MKVSRLLAALLLVSACSRDPGGEQQTASLREEPAVGTGDYQAPAPEKQPAAESRTDSPARDARIAAEAPVTKAAESKGTNVSAAILKDFKQRVDGYMDVRDKAVKNALPLKETSDPARIQAAQDSRRSVTRKLRVQAKHGDIFTPEIRHTFRQLLAPELKGEEGRDGKEVLKEDAPAPGAIPLQVNATYPEGAPLPTMPASLLANLPVLPKGVEYRIIGKDLVLLDSDANLIVDYMRNAIR